MRPACLVDEREFHRLGLAIDAQARIAGELGPAEDIHWVRAPGRVNLIGEHTDYNEGFVLPLAIDYWCVVAGRPFETVRVRSLDADGQPEIAADGSAEPGSVEPAWGRYVAGVLRELAARGRPAVGIDAVLASEVPLGAGLSSSAALEVATALALADAAGWTLDRVELAEACRAAEENATGVPCGIMDQLVSIAAVEGTALLIDCRSLALRPVPLPEDLALVAVHSGIARSLAAGEYAKRRRGCEDLARKLGVRALRDATEAQVADEPLGRHVVSENARVLASVDALEVGDAEKLGRILSAGHASLRDGFRISTPELDLLVQELVAAGAYGARLTGGGFGGCVVAVCAAGSVAAITERAMQGYRQATSLEPTRYDCLPVGGAHSFHPDRDAPT